MPKVPDEQLHHLIAELKYLRGLVHDIGENLIIRKEGEIESLIAHLQTLPGSTLRQIGKGWLCTARALNVKPAKGRLKDLHRLDELLTSLCDAIIACEDDEGNAKSPAREVCRKKKSAVKSPQENP